MGWLTRLRENAARAPTGIGAAEWPLRALLIASIALPLVIFTGVATMAYRRHFDEAHSRLDRALDQMHEHAAKVFETFELAARYTDELFADLTDEAIRASESDFHARLRVLTDTLPQLRDVWVIDRNGRPLVSGTIFPMPKEVDVSDRAYFTAHRNGTSGHYVSEVLESRVADRKIFLISRRRTDPATGAFNGVMTTAIAPEYFIDYYRRLPLEQKGFAMILREDGAILARFPQLPAASTRLTATSGFIRAIAGAPLGGTYRAISPFDGVERIVAYRRLPRHAVYVARGMEVRAIAYDWMRLMAGHLAFGVPATITMVLLSWMALQRTRRAARAHVELQGEVARRKDTEHALHQSQKMEAVGHLTGGVAHDFNNLLTAVTGNIDLTLHRLKGDDERTFRSLSSAKEAALRAASLTQRLLAFSRQHPSETKVIDVNRRLRGMSDLLQRTIGETVRIKTVLGRDVWKIAVDPHQLENAILNLAVNARDAMPQGGALSITSANIHLDAQDIAGGETLRPGPYVMIAVSDTGSGMSREVIEHAFEPFFTTKPSGVGTGLGLSMVYGFARQFGGHVAIDSAPGRGTTVRLCFPRSPAQRAESEREQPRAGGAAAPIRGGHETILLVEDDEAVNAFGSETLSELGYHVVSAHSAGEALALLQEEDGIALLFTDVVLPGPMNGRQLAEEAVRSSPGLKVLFTTGYTRNAVVSHGRLDPGVEVLLKPYTVDSLARAVRSTLDDQAAAA